MPHLTTFVLQSQHAPSEKEAEALVDALIADAEHFTGIQPLRAQAIFADSVPETPARKAHEEIKTTRVVNDGMVQGKWEARR